MTRLSKSCEGTLPTFEKKLTGKCIKCHKWKSLIMPSEYQSVLSEGSVPWPEEIQSCLNLFIVFFKTDLEIALRTDSQNLNHTSNP